MTLTTNLPSPLFITRQKMYDVLYLTTNADLLRTTIVFEKHINQLGEED